MRDEQRYEDGGQHDGAMRLLELHDYFLQARAIQLAAELGIADLLADGPQSVGHLAAATSTDRDALHRLLRTLTGCGIFAGTASGDYELTAMGAHLRRDHPRSVRSFMVLGGTFVGVFVDAMHSLRTGNATFSQTYGEPLFSHLRHHPDRQSLFDAAMADLSRLESDAVLNTYDFTRARTIVDVGGGDGSLLSAILLRYREARGVIFDQPHVAAAADNGIVASGLTGRCTFAAGDFFESVRPGGDLYLLKSIVHDWPDEQALTILRNCRRAMGPHGRLLLIERVLPANDAPHPSKTMDFAMLVLLGGRERTGDEYAALCGQAGLRLDRVIGTSTPSSILEVYPA
nr:acetylserotonin O-methyltransferase [Longimycelium tulufanense]